VTIGGFMRRSSSQFDLACFSCLMFFQFIMFVREICKMAMLY
jgi:hypothetical protein